MSLSREIRLENGCSETIETLYEKYRKPLYTFVFRYTGDQQLSIDVVQDTFEKLLKSHHYSPEKGKFKTYLFQIAYNTMVTRLKRRKKFWSLLPFVAADILGIPVGTVKSRLHHAMKKLKEDLEVDGDER